MANKKISELPELTTPANDDVLAIVDSSTNSTKKISVGNLIPADSVTSVNGQTGVVVLTKSDIGLGNVDNTSDVNKPISTATQTALDAKEATSNKSTDVVTDQASNTKYPSVKAVYDWVVGLLTGKQDTLVSGTNIKTINSTSLLGSGDIAIVSNPGGSDTQVQYNSAGSFAGSANLTFDGTTLDANKLNVQERVTIEADSTATTQSVAVIESTSTNAGIVLKPNGTGAIMAHIPDATVTGGNARGDNAVDLQTYRSSANQVAYGAVSVISGGRANTASNNYSTVSGGYSNISSGQFSYVGAGSDNTASSNYSTISGGQSNTASTNTHATVVGGLSNTASGQYSVAGGQSNTASGSQSCAIGGRNNVTSGTASATLGTQYSSALNSCSAVIGAFNSRTESNYSAIIGGDLGRTYLLGQVATGVRFSDGQRAQSSMVQAYNEQALSSGGTMNLSLDGTGITNLIGTPGGSFTRNVTVKWIAVCKSAGSGTTVAKETAIGTDVFMFRYDTATITPYISAITSVQSFAEASMTGATCSYSASSSNLIITFTAPSTANNTTFKVLAKVELVEIQL